MRVVKKVFLVVFLFLLFSQATGKVFAQTATDPCQGQLANPPVGQSENQSYNTICGHYYDAQVMNAASSSYLQNGNMSIPVFDFFDLKAKFWAVLGITGGAGAGVIDPTIPANLHGRPGSDSGAFGSLVGYVSDMYRYPVANTRTYVADVMQDMHVYVAQPAYAQGLGFSALNPILEIWKAFRNIAYLMFVLIFLVIGFMIMFRQKISAQAVVTVQQAIPSIVIALLAVTFSYAIAGLLIDGMYLVMYFMIAMFSGLLKGQVTASSLINGNILDITTAIIGSNIAGTGGQDVGNLVNNLFSGGVGGAIAGGFTTLSVAVIIFLVILFNAFKLFFSLLKVYIELIMNIAFAPIILMMGAIPGRDVFVPWIRSILGNLAVFPTILLFLLIFNVLRDATSVSQTGVGFLPPYLGGSGSLATIPFLAGIALILALPQAVEEVKKAVGGNQTGLFQTLIQAGLKNAQEQAKVGTAVAAVGAGLGAGALVGGGLELARGRGSMGDRIGRLPGSAARGALVGSVAAPLAVAVGPQLVTGLARGAMQQVGAAVGEQSFTRVINRIGQANSRKAQTNAAKQQAAIKSHTATTPQTDQQQDVQAQRQSGEGYSAD